MNRPVDPDFDPRIADWLEADPMVAPRELLATVLAAAPSVAQRRRVGAQWRFPAMPTRGFAVATAVVVAVALGGVALSRLASVGQVLPTTTPLASGSQSPSPTSSAAITLPPFDQRYASRIHPLAVEFPDGWVVTPASTVRATAAETFGDLDAFDRVDSGTARFIVASARLAPGESLDTFRVLADGQGGSGCGVPVGDQSSEDVTVAGDAAGAPAYVVARDCAELGPYRDWWRAVAARNGIVFEFQLDGDFTMAEGDALFQAFLLGVEIEQPAVPSASGLDATFTSLVYGYTVAYPATWTATRAATAAGTIDNPYPDTSGPSPFDEINCGPNPPGCGDTHVGYGTFFGFAAAAPGGQTAEQWVAANHQSECTSAFDRDVATLDGRTAFITQGGCPAGLAGYHYSAFVAANGLVYRFALTSPDGSDERFLAMLASIHLGSGPPVR